jgi:glyoxylase-like metal-dependent hydrolase (beta-lactamase superfamily II)
MIDAGADAEELTLSLDNAGISADQVKWIFLTHSDVDHVAALPLFLKAGIHISEAELPLLNGNINRSVLGGNSFPSEIDLTAIKSLKDGEELALGGVLIKCIASPGHTIGSMSYLVDGRYLFTGDAFLVDDAKMDIHPFTMDGEQATITIERLYEKANGTELVLTSHYGYYTSESLRRNPS